MDRKVCILLYSKYSQACIDLLKYINSLQFDFPSITGLSMLSVDNKKAKEACDKNGIKGVPVLLIEYFFVENSNMSKKQMLEKEQIYQWVDEVVNKILSNKNRATDIPTSESGKTSRGVTFLNSNNKSDSLPMLKISAFDETIEDEPKIGVGSTEKASTKHISAAVIAAEMEQQRKLEDEKFTAHIKKNKIGNSTD